MMQLFTLPHWLTICLFFILWFVFQMGAALFCFKLPDRVFASDDWLTRSRKWERNGAVYDRVFHVRSWKQYLPDGGAMMKGGYAKKHLPALTASDLDKFLLESRRAEWTHWLAILPFWVFGLFAPFWVVPVMLAYALAANLPCIITQRYNRPRLQRVQSRRQAV